MKRGIAIMLACTVILGVLFLLGGLTKPSLAAAKKELNVAYMNYPVHAHNVEWFKKWGKMNGVEVKATMIPYTVYLEKITAGLIAGSKEYDIIFHNDDWGQALGGYLEPLDDVKAIHAMDKKALIDPGMLWPDKDGKLRPTAFPLTETLGIFFYRKDLISPEEYPRTWSDLVKISKKLQKEGKIEWGIVGGMKYPNTYNTILWSLWANGCDIFSPFNERNNDVLAKKGWRTMLTEPCFRETIEFWWDNIHVHKISPPGQVGYTTTEADGIFMAGKALIEENDTTLYGKYNDPKKSKIAGNVAFAPFIMGPSAPFKSVAWRAAWFWAIPKAIAPEQKKLAKELLNWMGETEEVQMDLWKAVGGIPPNLKVQKKLSKEDPLFKDLRAAVVDVEYAVTPCYFFKQWPRVNATLSDVVTKALVGKREDIGKVLEEGGGKITSIMTQ